LNLCNKNGGLYIKLGQGIAAMNHILPPQYNSILSVLQDNAPRISYKRVEKVFYEDFKLKPHEIFMQFDDEPIASASIAQVHRAILNNGDVVAVKVQKPYIRHQMPWDMFTYSIVLYAFEKLFDLPIYWSFEYTEKNLRKEIDFINEAKNSLMSSFNLKHFDDIYIPKVHWDYTTSRILTAEWIDGVKLNQKQKIIDYGFSLNKVMESVIKSFGYQIFVSGVVHCDPHPGNILVRPHPDNKNRHQIVILDHGLYITESIDFRRQYCKFWKSLILLDTKEMQNICSVWGINDSEIFASFTIMKPFSPKKQFILKILPEKIY